MKIFFVCLTLFVLPLSSVFARSDYRQRQIITEVKSNLNKTNPALINSPIRTQQNLIGEVSSIDPNGEKIVILTEAKTSVTVTLNEKTAYKRVLPGQTLLVNAEQIKITDIKIGDRVLIQGGSVAEQTAARQITVMARAAINSQRDDELEKRRARAINGRITAVNAGKKEITVQSRGRGGDGVESFEGILCNKILFSLRD